MSEDRFLDRLKEVYWIWEKGEMTNPDCLLDDPNDP